MFSYEYKLPTSHRERGLLREKGPFWTPNWIAEAMVGYVIHNGCDHVFVPEKPLIAQRRPWYKMEARAVPPFLFAYLGRRNSRFIRNLAGVLPLTAFLCVYPLQDEPDYINKLWQVLRHPATTTKLSLVGKSYGGNAIKVEPRALEKLPLPMDVISEAVLVSPLRLLL